MTLRMDSIRIKVVLIASRFFFCKKWHKKAHPCLVSSRGGIYPSYIPPSQKPLSRSDDLVFLSIVFFFFIVIFINAGKFIRGKRRPRLLVKCTCLPIMPQIPVGLLRTWQGRSKAVLLKDHFLVSKDV